MAIQIRNPVTGAPVYAQQQYGSQDEALLAQSLGARQRPQNPVALSPQSLRHQRSRYTSLYPALHPELQLPASPLATPVATAKGTFQSRLKPPPLGAPALPPDNSGNPNYGLPTTSRAYQMLRGVLGNKLM